MKSISFFAFASFLLLATACMEPDCCDVVHSQEFFVSLKNGAGANLLDPNTDGAIDLSKTRLFLIENGEAKMVKDETLGAVLDNPFFVKPFEKNGECGVSFSFEYAGSQKDLEGFIQWNETLADTLTFTFNSVKKPSFIAKISQKGTVLWDTETAPENTNPVITLEH